MQRRRALSGLVYLFFELLFTAGAFLLAVWLRGMLSEQDLGKPFDPARHLWLLAVLLPVWAPLLWFWSFARAQRTDRPLVEIGKAVQVAVAGMLVLFAVLAALKFDPSRTLLGLFGALDIAALILFRLACGAVAQHQRKRGYDRVYVLVAGTGKAARRHLAELRAHPEWGLEVKGVLSEFPKLAIDAVEGFPIVGALADLPAMLRKEVVDEVHFAVSRRTLERLDEAVRVCDEMGVTVRLAMSPLGALNSRPTLEHVGATPFLTLSSVPRDEAGLLVKRVFDVTSSAVALLVLSPLLIAAAFLVKLTSKGPAVFRQKRSGMSGRVFTLYKFRTMVQDAEALKAQLEKRNEVDGPVFKIKDDPRITGVGKWLRKLSIDELPQLWNVLRGDMSIVGPRPPLPAEVEKYERWQRRRLSMRPGITCIWQVSGRSNIDFRRWMEMDLEYIDNWSLFLDFKIILRTIPAVLSSRGAS